MSIQPSVRIMFLFRTFRRPIINYYCTEENVQRLHNSAPAVIISAPKIQNAISATWRAHLLHPWQQYFAWKEDTELQKYLFFSIENVQQQQRAELPPFVPIIKSTKLDFVSPVITVCQSSHSSLLTEDWLYQCQHVFQSRADIRMQGSLLCSDNKKGDFKKGGGWHPGVPADVT